MKNTIVEQASLASLDALTPLFDGIASSLISAAVDFAKAVGAVRLTFSTAVTNKPAQTLYSASGWKKDEQFFFYNFATGV